NNIFNTGLLELSVLTKIICYSPLIHKKNVKELKFKHDQGEFNYDYYVTSQAIDYISNYKNKDTKLMIIHLTDTDKYGHYYGFGSQKYLKQIKIMDNQIGNILNAVKQAK
ncbi:10489_t:CDS:1, partial [Dentiscutata heterogama]